MFWLLGCVHWGLLATVGGNTTILFAEKLSPSLFSNTLFATPHRRNRVFRPAGRHATLLSSSKHSPGLFQNSCLQLVHVAYFCPTAAWRLPGPCLSCNIFFKLLSCCCNCLFSPVIFLIVAAISALLVVRVVSFVTNSSSTDFSSVVAAAILPKYPARYYMPNG